MLPSTEEVEKENVLDEICGPEEPDKPFDISDFKGPNLSEDESDSETSDSKKLKSFPSMDFEDNDISELEKSQFGTDLNGHETVFGYDSPDMANYDLLPGKETVATIQFLGSGYNIHWHPEYLNYFYIYSR